MEKHAGKMVLTGRQAKEADRIAIEELGIPSLRLMENASAQVSWHLRSQQAGRPVLIVSGVGNNGADGVCIARQLLEHGYVCAGAAACTGSAAENKGVPELRLLIVGDLRKATWEFLRQLSDFRRLGGRFEQYAPGMEMLWPGGVPQSSVPQTEMQPAVGCSEAGTVLVDAVFGIGLTREVGGIYREVLEMMEQHPGFRVAVDIPSGVNADNGCVMGCAVRADVTITFGRNKTGLVTGGGARLAGIVRVAEIGIPEEAYRRCLER